MKTKKLIFITVLSLLIVSLAVTIIFFIDDLNGRAETEQNNAPPPSMFSINELSLALGKTNYRLPLDEDYSYNFEVDSNFLFIEDGFICPFNTGSTYILVEAKFEDQTFFHSIAISIYDITIPSFNVTSNADNSFTLSATDCPALNIATIVTNPQLNFSSKATINKDEFSRVFTTNTVSQLFTVCYSIELDNFTSSYTQNLTATQEYVAHLTHTNLHIIDGHYALEANNDGFYNESEFVLSKDYNLENFSSELIIENTNIIEMEENRLLPLKAGKTKVYVLLNGEEIFSETITVSIIEAEQINVNSEQNVGTSFKLQITPCYASTIIKYDSLYLSYSNGNFLPLKTGDTTITIYSGTKTITKQITINFSQSSVESITNQNKNIKLFELEKELNAWFTINIVNVVNNTYSQNQKFSVNVSTDKCITNFDFAPSYDFKFLEKGSYYIIAIIEDKIHSIYHIVIK